TLAKEPQKLLRPARPAQRPKSGPAASRDDDRHSVRKRVFRPPIVSERHRHHLPNVLSIPPFRYRRTALASCVSFGARWRRIRPSASRKLMSDSAPWFWLGPCGSRPSATAPVSSS